MYWVTIVVGNVELFIGRSTSGWVTEWTGPTTALFMAHRFYVLCKIFTDRSAAEN